MLGHVEIPDACADNLVQSGWSLDTKTARLSEDLAGLAVSGAHQWSGGSAVRAYARLRMHVSHAFKKMARKGLGRLLDDYLGEGEVP